MYRMAKLREIRESGGRRWLDSTMAGPSVHASWKLPICLRPKVGKAGQEANQNQMDAQRNAPVTMTYLGLQCCVLPGILSVHPTVLDFGEVTAQQRMLLPITIHNVTPADAQKLKISPLPENACFTVLNAPRDVRAKDFQLVIEFKPQYAQIYGTTLMIYSQKTRVQVQLRGKGVRPVLKIKPESGILHLGSVVFSKAGTDYTTAKLEIDNESPFELGYRLESDIPAEQHHQGVPPFTLTPSSGVVKGHSQKEVTVTFRPHRPLLLFKEKLLVNVPNQKEATYVYLNGHCFQYQIFVMYDIDFGPFGREEAQRTDAFVDSLALGAGTAASGEGGEFVWPSAQQRQFSLVFGHDERQKNLMVGACVPPGTPNNPVSSPAPTYTFDVQPSEFSDFFTVEAPGAAAGKQAKGSVAPNGTGVPSVKVAFKYNPPADTSLEFGGMNLDLLTGIGQWITCTVKGVLSGGFVPPPDPPTSTQEITVELKAYLQQI
jgi:hypothetical protein